MRPPGEERKGEGSKGAGFDVKGLEQVPAAPETVKKRPRRRKKQKGSGGPEVGAGDEGRKWEYIPYIDKVPY